jgi:long-chain fatty acid transport protein
MISPLQMRIFFSFLFITTTLNVFPGGFQVNLQGQKQSGMGHTGTATLLDAGSVFFNPGAVSFLQKNSVTPGISFIIPRVVYLEAFPGVYTSQMVSQTGTPFSLYANYKRKEEDKLAFGIGIYTPFGSSAQWDDDWKGRFLIREISLKTIFIQPTLSYQVNEKLGIGAGFIYATGGFLLRRAVPVQFQDGNYGEASLEGNASGIGFNGGVFYKLTEKLNLGVSYRSNVNVTVSEGTADFNVPSSLVEHFPEGNTFSTSIKLPSVLSAGIGYQWTERTLLAFDFNYIGWSSYDTLRIDFTENTERLEDIRSPRMYKNSMIFRIGGSHRISDLLTMRAGAYIDRTPVKSGYLTPETPDADKLGLTLGLTVSPRENFKIDFSFLMVEGSERTDTNLETGFTGTYKSRALIPGIGINYLF